MKPINEEQLQNRLSSGSKNRLRMFRKNLLTDRDVRNYDAKLNTLILEYLQPRNREMYLRTKEYLRDLKSSKDGKFFSQGVKSYVQILESVKRFQQPNHPSFRWNQNYQRAKTEITKIFSDLKLKMLVYYDDESMKQALPKDDTHSGFMYLETGMRKKRENLAGIYHHYSLEEELARKCGSFNKPILPGTRTQGSGAFTEDGKETGDCKHKTRLVSMIDLRVIFAELKFAKPIQDAIAEMKFYAGGKNPSDISSIILGLRHEYGYWLSMDYSSYDQSLSDWLIRDVFDILRTAFVDCDEELFQIVVNDFIEKNFILGDGVYHSRKGVPSGSMFTQIVDSVANILMIHTYMIAKNLRGNMIVMGDDNLWYVNHAIDYKEVSTYLGKNFGVVMNSDKTIGGSSSQDPSFLARVWKWNGQYRETRTVISKMLYPERWRDYESGKVDEVLVLYAYILTYRATMINLIDVGRFLRDHRNLGEEYVFDKVDSRYLPGALAYIREYTRSSIAA